MPLSFDFTVVEGRPEGTAKNGVRVSRKLGVAYYKYLVSLIAASRCWSGRSSVGSEKGETEYELRQTKSCIAILLRQEYNQEGTVLKYLFWYTLCILDRLVSNLQFFEKVMFWRLLACHLKVNIIREKKLKLRQTIFKYIFFFNLQVNGQKFVYRFVGYPDAIGKPSPNCNLNPSSNAGKGRVQFDPTLWHFYRDSLSTEIYT